MSSTNSTWIRATASNVEIDDEEILRDIDSCLGVESVEDDNHVTSCNTASNDALLRNGEDGQSGNVTPSQMNASHSNFLLDSNTDTNKASMDQHASGITEVNISLAVTANTQPDLSVMSSERSVSLLDEVASVGSGVGSDSFVTDIEISVPRKVSLEICFEPECISGQNLGEKQIEIEVSAGVQNSITSPKQLTVQSAQFKKCSANKEYNAAGLVMGANLDVEIPLSTSSLNMDTLTTESDANYSVDMNTAKHKIFEEMDLEKDDELNKLLFEQKSLNQQMRSEAEQENNQLNDVSDSVEHVTAPEPSEYLSPGLSNYDVDTCMESQKADKSNAACFDAEKSEEDSGTGAGSLFHSLSKSGKGENSNDLESFETECAAVTFALDVGSPAGSESPRLPSPSHPLGSGECGGLKDRKAGLMTEVAVDGATDSSANDSDVDMVSDSSSQTTPLKRKNRRQGLHSKRGSRAKPAFTTSAQELSEPSSSLESEGDKTSSHVEDSDDSLSDGPEFLNGFRIKAASTPKHCKMKGALQHTFSLDTLLRDKKLEADEMEIRAVQSELRKDLLSNTELDNTQEENDSEELDDEFFLTEDQRNTLKTLKQDEVEIRDSHPGELILKDQLYGRLFTQSLSPTACGWTDPSRGCFWQLFGLYQPDMLMVASDIISLSYHALPCKAQLQRWLFFVMCVDSSSMEKCREQLLHVLQWQMEDVYQGREKFSWAPSIADIGRVLYNWGAEKEGLSFSSSMVDQLREVMVPLESGHGQENTDPCRNVEPMVKMLASWLQARPPYDAMDLNHLLLMLCKLSLDPKFSRRCLLYDLQICIASILENYEDTEWYSVVPRLCRQLSSLSAHHHNQVYVNQLFANCSGRGAYLQQRLAYLLLHSALGDGELSDHHICSFQLHDLLSLTQGLKDLVQTDNYLVSSLISLLDLSVGRASQYATERKLIYQMMDEVKLVVSEIRDSVQRLDCTKIKGMLLHLCLKWDLSMKSTNIKQRKIFSCFQSKSCVSVEKLEDQASQGCDIDDRADADSQAILMDDDCTVEYPIRPVTGAEEQQEEPGQEQEIGQG